MTIGLRICISTHLSQVSSFIPSYKHKFRSKSPAQITVGFRTRHSLTLEVRPSLSSFNRSAPLSSFIMYVGVYHLTWSDRGSNRSFQHIYLVSKSPHSRTPCFRSNPSASLTLAYTSIRLIFSVLPYKQHSNQYNVNPIRYKSPHPEFRVFLSTYFPPPPPLFFLSRK